MTTETFVVTTMFRGQLNLSTMRMFTDVRKAWDYYDMLYGDELFKGVWRLYETRAPERIKR